MENKKLTQKQKQEKVMRDFLNYRWNIYKNMGKNVSDEVFYHGACQMIVVLGGHWVRNADGTHVVILPDKKIIDNLNLTCWE